MLRYLCSMMVNVFSFSNNVKQPLLSVLYEKGFRKIPLKYIGLPIRQYLTACKMFMRCYSFQNIQHT